MIFTVIAFGICNSADRGALGFWIGCSHKYQDKDSTMQTTVGIVGLWQGLRYGHGAVWQMPLVGFDANLNAGTPWPTWHSNGCRRWPNWRTA